MHALGIIQAVWCLCTVAANHATRPCIDLHVGYHNTLCGNDDVPNAQDNTVLLAGLHASDASAAPRPRQSVGALQYQSCHFGVLEGTIALRPDTR